MVDEDLLSTDLVITGRDGFSVNIDSPEWREGEAISRIGRTLLMIGGSALGFAITPGLIELVRVVVSKDSSLIASAISAGIIATGFLMRIWGKRIIDNYIHARVQVMEDSGELFT